MYDNISKAGLVMLPASVIVSYVDYPLTLLMEVMCSSETLPNLFFFTGLHSVIA
jgi:hypothetical protein